MRNIKKNSFFRRIGIISFVVTTLACISSFINKRKIKEQNHSLIQVKEDKSLLVEKPIYTNLKHEKIIVFLIFHSL